MGPFEEYYIYAQKMIVQKGDIRPHLDGQVSPSVKSPDHRIF